MTEGNTVTIGQLARAGAFLRAARLLRDERDYWYIMNNLRREFLVGTDLQYHTIIKLAEKGVAAATALENLQPGETLDNSLIPKLPR
jgi:hypothetical protein